MRFNGGRLDSVELVLLKDSRLEVIGIWFITADWRATGDKYFRFAEGFLAK